MGKNLLTFEQFLAEKLSPLQCEEDTKSYIVGIYSKYKVNQGNLSDNSLTLKFAEARARYDFKTFQDVGDWIFWCFSLYPEHLKNSSQDYYFNLGSESYGYCYRMLNGNWKLFQDLSCNFISLETQAQKLIGDLRLK
jgi:hypothetical protein